MGRPDTTVPSDEQRPKLGYMPGLDGLRAAALLAVLLFHEDFTWAKGGYLGVTTFFVLSGFLITSLLLVERRGTGTLNLGGFWARRLRRLAPALLVLVALVAVLSAIAPPRSSSGVVGDGIAALGWVANWRFVFAHKSYGQIFSQPSPFDHTWSLGIEEQFYLLIAFLALVFIGRGRMRRGLLAATVFAGIVASTLLAAALHPAGADAGRAYYGTDTRLAEPLVGVLLALLLVGRRGIRVLTRPGRALCDVVGVAGIAGLVLMVAREGQGSDFLYRGGLLLAAVLSAGVVAAASQPGLVSRALSFPPLVALGKISYGAYLFHWPLYLWITSSRTGLYGGQLFLMRAGATIALSTWSYALVEHPIRRGAVLRGPALAIGWVNASVVVVAALMLALAIPKSPSTELASGTTYHPRTATGAGAVAGATPPGGAAAAAAARNAPAAKALTAAPGAAGTAGAGAHTTTTAKQPASVNETPQGEQWSTTPGPVPAVPPGSLKVAVVGDSMADGLSYGLERWADTRGDVVVYDLARAGCPISRDGDRRFPDGYHYWNIDPDCSWWSNQYSERYQDFQSFNPDVVVVEDGLNEVPDRKLPSWSTWRYPGEPEFDSWLVNEYTTALQTFSKRGAKLVFLNAACVDWQTFGGAMGELGQNNVGDNRIVALNQRTQALSVTGASQADLNAHLCPNGKFNPTVDGVNNGRPDGYHLTKAASEAVANKWLGPIVLQTAGKPSTAI
jgi:peptidoglycan/LPS O-acetylase OafA/YrhL